MPHLFFHTQVMRRIRAAGNALCKSSDNIFCKWMNPDAKKKPGKNGEKQHAGLLYSMGCSKTVTQKKDGYCCNAP